MASRWRTYAGGVAACLVAIGVAGCGGGGGGSGGGTPTPPPPSTGWVAGSFLPAATFAGRCVSPRSGQNPSGGVDIQGAAVDENNWLRSWSNDLYLWYDEIVDRNPSLYTTPDYFDLLVTTAITPSGQPKDKFHFTFDTTEWIALQQSGTEGSYGAVWAVEAPFPPRRIVVAYTHPNSPAVAANLERGEEILFIDGIDVVNVNTQAGVQTFVAGLYPDGVGQSHTFVLRNPGTGAQRTVNLQSATVTLDPVQSERTIPTPTGNVGYLHFTDHLPTAEQPLIDAFTAFDAANVTDLVLDLRYNGGGSLAIASEVAYMIAGNARTAGQTFEQLVFNNKHTTVNPFTGGPLTPFPFFSGSSAGQPLPSLDLQRVYVLTSEDTCSASESIINGLRGVGVQVVQIGSTTCGKPYGFVPEDNCGTTYFTIQFQGVNAAGFGDYGDGFSPQNSSSGGEPLPGCSVRDDYAFALGDEKEARLAAALEHRMGGTCPVPSGSKPFFSKPENGASGEPPGGVVRKSPWLTNRWVESS